MKKTLAIVFGLTVLLIIGGILVINKKENATGSTPSDVSSVTSPPSHLEYYWGNGCPHCKNVADFLDSWDRKDEVEIEKFETWYVAQNAQKLKKVAEYCSIPANQVGVPLLFTPSGDCITGDQPIIDYLKALPSGDNGQMTDEATPSSTPSTP